MGEFPDTSGRVKGAPVKSFRIDLAESRQRQFPVMGIDRGTA